MGHFYTLNSWRSDGPSMVAHLFKGKCDSIDELDFFAPMIGSKYISELGVVK